MPRTQKNPCSEFARTLTELALNVASRPNVKDIDGVLAVLEKDLPGLTRSMLTDSIAAATSGYVQTRDALREKLNEIKREARGDVNLRRAAIRIEQRIAEGTGPSRRPRKASAPETQKLRERVADLQAELRRADPKTREDLRRRIAELDGHIAAGTVPAKKPDRPAPADVQALRDTRDAKARQAAQADPQRRTDVRESIDALEAHLKAGTVPPKAPRKAAPADLQNLRNRREALRREVMKADPARREAIRKQIAEVNKHIRDGTYPVATPAKAAPADIQALRDELDAARAELRRQDPKIRQDLRRQITELQGHIDAGTLPPRTPKEQADVPDDVQELRDARDELKAALAKSDPALREKFEAQIEELAQRLEDGVSPPPTVEKPMMSPELERLKYQAERLKTEIRNRIDAMKPKTVWGRAWDMGAEPINALRSIMTSMDFSGVLRQGGFVAIGNPARAARSLGPMFRAFADPAKSHAINEAILNRPNAYLYKRSGLYLAPDQDASSLNAREEAYMSRWIEKIPLVAGSQRAYATFLNSLRVDSFDAMVNTLAIDGQPTDVEMKAIANYINVATGRGYLGVRGENAAQLLNTLFFAPRYVASRFQLIVPTTMIGGTARTRKAIAREYVKFLTGIGVVYMLGALAGGEIGKDPTSSDFGKLKFGDTRVDPLAGMSQAAVFAWRFAAGERTNIRGKTTELDGRGKYNTRGAVAQDFIRSKASPAAGTVYDFAFGETPSREPFTYAGAAKNLVVPMQVDSLIETFKEQDVPEATAMSILSVFGMGVNTYE